MNLKLLFVGLLAALLRFILPYYPTPINQDPTWTGLSSIISWGLWILLAASCALIILNKSSGKNLISYYLLYKVLLSLLMIFAEFFHPRYPMLSNSVMVAEPTRIQWFIQHYILAIISWSTLYILATKFNDTSEKRYNLPQVISTILFALMMAFPYYL